MALRSTQSLTEMSTRSISWGQSGRWVRLTTYHHPVPLSRNLGTLSSWNPLGLLYLTLAVVVVVVVAVVVLVVMIVVVIVILYLTLVVVVVLVVMIVVVVVISNCRNSLRIPKWTAAPRTV